MKRKFLLVLTLGVALLVTYTSCNLKSGNKTEEKATFNQEVFNQQIQGVLEYLPPNQGLAANFDNHFIFIFGDSDSTMVSQMGTYKTTGDTVIYTTLYSSNPELVGTVIRWSADFTNSDSIKVVIFDESGNISMELYNRWKAKLDDNTISQLKKFEGSYKYASGRGGGIILSGYGIYITQSGGAGIYEEKNDTVIFKRLFSTDPELIGTELTWVNESRTGDTLNWAVINKTGEVVSTGQSLY
ncbi:hypothetical protein [Maribellus mangrovi]|uniref:hypothetical protein n=1 Tax=Maribellus mangrovi TaxID=3133146 RepID=UPI0030EE605A